MELHVGKSEALTHYVFDHSFEESALQILKQAADEIESPCGHFVVLDDESASLVCVATCGGGNCVEDQRDNGHALAYPIESSPNDWVRCFKTGEPVVRDIRCQSPRWPFYGTKDAFVKTALYVPIQAARRSRAALGFFGRTRHYTEDDARVVTELVSTATRIALQERALRKLREVSSIYDSIADVLFTLAVEPNDIYRFASINRSFLQATGLSRSSVLGRDFREVIPKPALELVLSKYREAVREKRVAQWEEVSVHPAGTKYGEVLVKPVFDEFGRCTHLVGTIHDVTNHHLAEEALKVANEKYRTFFDNSLDAILLTAPDGSILEANRAACEMFGYSEKELASAGRSAVVVSSDPRLARLLEEREKIGKARGELLLRRQDGTTFPAEISSAVFTDADGNLRTSMVVHDISHRVAAQEKIESNERYFRAVIENGADIILVITPEGVVSYCSPSVERELGYHPKRIIGNRMTELGIFGSAAEVETALAAVGRTKGVTIPFSIVATTLHGDTRLLAGVARNAINEPAVGGIVVNLRDVTEMERNELERERLRNELEQARKMESVGRLAGGVAHDFNNHLTVILGHVELMLTNMAPGAPGYDGLIAIRSAAERSAELTRQLLGFARRQSISPQIVDLNDTIDGMLRMLRRLIGEDVALVWRPAPHLWAVKLDPTQVDQILVNLCLNARDSIAGAGRIMISTQNRRFDRTSADRPEWTDPGDYVMLSVSDNGSGMDEEALSKVFEPFYAIKDKGKGTGMGAATVYGIVKQNRGYVAVSSKEGKGTTFDLFFRREEEPVQASRDLDTHPVVSGGNETILLVEDDPDILDATTRLLESLGYRVLASHDATEAIGISDGHEREIDLIITDVVMPGLNGRELSDRLLQSRPNVKTLFVSGYTADVIAMRGVLDKGVNFLEKPYSYDVLAAKIREILSNVT